MKLLRLNPSHNLSDFDCGDADLNEFLKDDALDYAEKRIANTFILVDGDRIVAYFCLLNDKISQEELTNNQWKKIKKTFPDGKHFRSYPAIKIGRLAVATSYKGQSIGTDLIAMLKDMLNGNPNYSAFRYLTVDAYKTAVGFYEKNDFKHLSEKRLSDHTCLMFFDMLEIQKPSAQ